MEHNIPTQHDDNKLKSILNGYPSVVPSSGEQAKYHFINNDLNIHGMVCVYVYPHATCNNDESIHDTC